MPILIFNGLLLLDIYIVHWVSENSYRNFRPTEAHQDRTELLKLREEDT
jgi:hypothetical protein